MDMHNPPHPGEFLTATYLEPFGLSIRQVAAELGIAPSTLQRLVQGRSRVTPEMALRLSHVLGRSPQSWLTMQDQYDLWDVRQRLDCSGLKRLQFQTT